MLNKSKGNMYDWVTGTWNPLGGQCYHQCSYCYVQNMLHRPATRDKYTGKIRLHEKAFKGLGKKNFWFVCSLNDLFAQNVPHEYIESILNYLSLYSENKYLLQTKNPHRVYDYILDIPNDVYISTTVESNKYYPSVMNMAPEPRKRIAGLFTISCEDIPTMITVEPIMDFDLDQFVRYLLYPSPKQINIGADSKGHNLPEPEPSKIKELISALSEFTEVKLKKNLNRLLK